MNPSGFYTPREEWANALSHAAGILLGIIAGIVLLSVSIQKNDAWAILSIGFYLSGMLASYISSTCYHASRHPVRKEFLRKCDHAAIYLHIAGTYVPFTWIVLSQAGLWGWGLFTLNYLAASIGIVNSFRNLKKHSHIETICFIVMGCSILVAYKPLIEILEQSFGIEVLYWLIAGGVSFIIGAIFYSFSKRYMHTVFHLFVLGGSICHIQAIYLIL